MNYFYPPRRKLDLESDNGFNLGGNPYPSPLNWDLIWNDADNTGFNPICSIWQNVGDISNIGEFFYYDATDPSATTDPLIFNGVLAIGQGFRFVTNVNDNVMTMKNAHRVGLNSTKFNRQAVAKSKINFGLKIDGGHGLSDFVHVAFADGYINEYDRSADALKQENTHVNFAVNKGDTKLAFARMPMSALSEVTNISLSLKEEGSYTFSAPNLDFDNTDLNPYLIDRVTNKVVEVSKSFQYTVNLSSGDHNKRFAVGYVNKNSKIDVENLVNSSTFWVGGNGESLVIKSSLPNLENAQYRMIDLNGRMVSSGILAFDGAGSSSIRKTGLTNQIYILEIVAPGGVKILKVKL